MARYSSCIRIDAMNELFPEALRSLCATKSTNYIQFCFCIDRLIRNVYNNTRVWWLNEKVKVAIKNDRRTTQYGYLSGSHLLVLMPDTVVVPSLLFNLLPVKLLSFAAPAAIKQPLFPSTVLMVLVLLLLTVLTSLIDDVVAVDAPMISVWPVLLLMLLTKFCVEFPVEMTLPAAFKMVVVPGRRAAANCCC